MDHVKKKVFGIGFGRTGTTTLAACLTQLGYNHCGYSFPLVELYAAGRIDDLVETAKRYDSFDDFPWPLMYRRLVEEYPHAAYILTKRITSKVWLLSLIKHHARIGPNLATQIVFGRSTPIGFGRRHVRIYEKHNADVCEFFADRGLPLLQLCWEQGDGWAELCEFLGHSVPGRPLPHENKAPAEHKNLVSQIKNFERHVRVCLAAGWK